MSLGFGHYSIEYTEDGVIVTLFVRSDDYELARELADIKNIDGRKEINLGIMDYLGKNLPELKVNLIRIIAGTFLVSVVIINNIQTAHAGSSLQKRIQNAINSSHDISIIVDKKLLKFPQTPFILSGVTYVPIREIAEAIGSKVNWDENLKVIEITKNTKTIKFVVGSNKAMVDSTIVDMPMTYLVNKRTMVPVKFLSETLGLKVTWNDEVRLVIISSTNEVLTQEEIEQLLPDRVTSVKPASIPYTSEDLYWLSRIVNAEAKGESYSAKVAVANVIINRTQHPDYPDTIKDVVFDNNHGVQFQPVSNGSIYDNPLPDSLKAAKEALEGSNIAPGALFFLNPRIISRSWIVDNRKFAFQLENHDFYY